LLFRFHGCGDGRGDGRGYLGVQRACDDVVDRKVLRRELRDGAAASFMAGVMRRAPASRAPRKMPGKASTLLIWLGKSLRPVATTAAHRSRAFQVISAVGRCDGGQAGWGALPP
jgi:hypothetical protein